MNLLRFQLVCCCPVVVSRRAHPESVDNARGTMVEYLLRERVSLRRICRAMGVSLTWRSHIEVDCPMVVIIGGDMSNWYGFTYMAAALGLALGVAVTTFAD